MDIKGIAVARKTCVNLADRRRTGGQVRNQWMNLNNFQTIHIQLRTPNNIESVLKIKYEIKYLFFGFLVAVAVAIMLIHIILFIVGGDNYMGTTSAVLLGSSACVSIFIILSNRTNIEARKFKLLFIGVTLWFLGEFTYTYYQLILNTDAPYPGLGELFYVAGYVPLILFTYRSFKNINRDGLIKRRQIAFVVIVASIVPLISTIEIFSQEVDLQTQWPDIILNVIYNYGDIILLSLSVLILTRLPRNNPYIFHWILFTSFLILATITDIIYLHIAIVDEEFLSKTEIMWEAMWAFAYLCILASLVWYYKLIHLLTEDSENLLEGSTVDKSNISVEDYGVPPEEHQLHKEDIHNFKLVENRIDETIKGTGSEITIFFSNLNTLQGKVTQSILKFLKKKNRSNISARILFPFGADDRIIDSYREVANVRIFEKKLEKDKIIIVADLVRLLLISTKDQVDYDEGRTYAITYSENDEIAYTYVTLFEKLWLLQAVTELEVT